MSWEIGYDEKWKRDIGYGVPSVCDYPGCDKKIDRGLAHVCGGEPYGGEHGCGLFFCPDHRDLCVDEGVQMCERCAAGEEPFEPTPDTMEWMQHKLTDESWAEWREENPTAVVALKVDFIYSQYRETYASGMEGTGMSDEEKQANMDSNFLAGVRAGMEVMAEVVSADGEDD